MKKVLSLALASSMLLSSFGFAAEAPESNFLDLNSEHKVQAYRGSSFDLGIANDEKLIEMLKDEGKISKNATLEEAEKALNKYLKSKAESTKKRDNQVKGIDKVIPGAKNLNNGTFNGKGVKKGHVEDLDSLEKESYNGNVRKDKVLVLAIDFPDYENGSITKEETDMWYEDYPNEHFQNMIFGKDGYKGPNGETLVSMRQYYEEQSGGSYTVDGTVAGWYTADHPAAYYGGNYPTPDGSDHRPRELVFEALTKAGQDPNIDLSEYDVWDRDDYDGDGVYNEPDGIIDHLMVIHAGVGEEAGGGKLGGDAIWSHRWNLGNLVAVPGGTSNSDRFGGLLGAYDYTIEPEDGAAGVFAHEYGHDLGLPDEYDTQYTGEGEPVGYWSLMSSGSWAGDIPGTEPTGMSPYAKEFLQAVHGGNWLSGTTIEVDEITSKGVEAVLDQASSKGVNNDVVRINLPDKESTVNTPAGGEYEYFSGRGDEIDNKMVTSVDLSGVKEASLNYDVWYNIESNWDFGMVQISTDDGETWTSLETPNTVSDIVEDGYPEIKENVPGYTGNSNGWLNESLDLSDYAGQKVKIQFRYMTDWGTNLDGLYVDNINVTADGTDIFSDDAESDTLFTLEGFSKDTGKSYSNHYYLVEWRTHTGVDEGLSNIRRGDSLMSFDPGMLVWYVDNSYDNNWTGAHPGEGFLGIVDADQRGNEWSDKSIGSTRYQIHDAAFSTEKSSKMFLDYTDLLGVTMKDNYTKANALFDDSNDYSNPDLVDAGRNISNYGLKIRVVGKSKDNSVGKILLFK